MASHPASRFLQQVHRVVDGSTDDSRHPPIGGRAEWRPCSSGFSPRSFFWRKSDGVWWVLLWKPPMCWSSPNGASAPDVCPRHASEPGCFRQVPLATDVTRVVCHAWNGFLGQACGLGTGIHGRNVEYLNDRCRIGDSVRSALASLILPRVVVASVGGCRTHACPAKPVQAWHTKILKTPSTRSPVKCRESPPPTFVVIPAGRTRLHGAWNGDGAGG